MKRHLIFMGISAKSYKWISHPLGVSVCVFETIFGQSAIVFK